MSRTRGWRQKSCLPSLPTAPAWCKSFTARRGVFFPRLPEHRPVHLNGVIDEFEVPMQVQQPLDVLGDAVLPLVAVIALILVGVERLGFEQGVLPVTRCPRRLTGLVCVVEGLLPVTPCPAQRRRELPYPVWVAGEQHQHILRCLHRPWAHRHADRPKPSLGAQVRAVALRHLERDLGGRHEVLLVGNGSKRLVPPLPAEEPIYVGHGLAVRLVQLPLVPACRP